MTQAAKIIGKVRRGVQNVAYGNALYQKILEMGETPVSLHFTPSDLWPGDAHAGETLLSGQPSMFERFDEPKLLNSATTLRNLRALGTDAARKFSVTLIDSWLNRFESWDKDEWTPKNLGSRIATWIGFYDFYAPAASEDFTQRLVASLYRQWKHLERTVAPSLKGLESIEALRGLIYGGFNFPHGDETLGLACDLLQRQLTTEILTDGGHISRNPSVQFHMLRHLADIKNVLETAGIGIPPIIKTSLSALVPGVKFFRYGDGGMALFHGSVEESPLLIDAVLTCSGVRGRLLRHLPETGYERITSGRSLLLADVASPPPRSHGQEGHAGLLSFEFSIGKERLIVNCGSVPEGLPEWRAACAATAAHSTLTVNDTNVCDIDTEGGIAGHAQTFSQRIEENGTQVLEMAHNGYMPRFGLTHNRLLKLSVDGETLMGRELLQTRKRNPFTLRWHLHPSVQVSLAQGGQTALLKTASGNGWRLRIERGELGLESSIYCGGSAPRRSMQIQTTGMTETDETVVTWKLSRERKA